MVMAARREQSNEGLVAAGFSAMLQRPVITQQEYEKRRHEPEFAKVEELNYERLSETVYTPAAGSFGDILSENGVMINVRLTSLTGKVCVLNVREDSYVEELQALFEEKENLSGCHGRLAFVYKDREIQEGHRLSEYQVQDNSTIYVSVRLLGNAPVPMVLDPKLLDPSFDYDFTNMVDDGTQYMRGGKVYQRPYGWKRIALKVIGKYEDDYWLGPRGIRKGSSCKEWPVSYHGTEEGFGKSIADEGYNLSKCKRFRFGKGIYSSPSIAVAEQYATEFHYENDRFKVVMQNRVKDENLKIIPAIKCGNSDVEYWVQPNDKFIRPYGICIKHLGMCETVSNDSNTCVML